MSPKIENILPKAFVTEPFIFLPIPNISLPLLGFFFDFVFFFATLPASSLSALVSTLV